MSGKVIVFEGPDGVGKSTQAKLLNQNLDKSFYISSPFYNQYDNGYTLKAIKELLKNGIASEEPKTFQKLFVDNRRQWIIESLPILKNKYKYVIIDRWNLSTYVYGQDIRDLNYLTELLRTDIYADLQIVFLGNSFRKNPQDKFEEKDYADTIKERYNRYLADQKYKSTNMMLKLLPQNTEFIFVEPTNTILSIHNQIINLIKAI